MSASDVAWCGINSEELLLASMRAVSVTDLKTHTTHVCTTSQSDVFCCSYCSLINYMAITTDQRRKVTLFDMSTEPSDLMTELHFDADVLAVRLNAKRLCVVCPTAIHLFDLNTLSPLPLIRTSNPVNTDGLVALGNVTSQGECFLAVPQSSQSADPNRGDLFIIDVISCDTVAVAYAHHSRVALLAVSGSGVVFATCSVKGDVLKVFSATGQLLWRFRRGNSPTTMYSIALDAEGGSCVCTSSSGTLHVFRGSSVDGPSEEIRSFAKLSLNSQSRPISTLSADGRTVWVVAFPPKLTGTTTDASTSQEFSNAASAAPATLPFRCTVNRFVIEESTLKRQGSEMRYSAP